MPVLYSGIRLKLTVVDLKTRALSEKEVKCPQK